MEPRFPCRCPSSWNAARRSAVSVRTNDRERMRQLGRNSHAAGLASLADAKLSDRIFSFQFLAGVDYAMDERFSAGLKLRYHIGG